MRSWLASFFVLGVATVGAQSSAMLQIAVRFESVPVADATVVVNPGWSFTFIGGGHWQEKTDVNEDSWSDLPGYSRGVVRPRLFWDGGDGRTFFATAGFTAEDREGGGSPAGLTYREALDTRRVDAGAVGQLVWRQRYGRHLGTWEREEVGRLGVEFYYTGEKRLEENSFHGTSRPYFIIDALAERQVGRVRVVRERPRRRI